MVISNYITPVMYIDPSGEAWWDPFSWSNTTKIIVGVAVIATLGIATVLTGGAAAGVAGFILSGAFQGALAGALTGAAGGALIGGVVGGVTTGSWEGALTGAIDGAATGFMTGAFIGGVTGAASNALKIAKAARSWACSSTQSSYRTMVNHYTDHVINEGQKHLAKNIVNYSKHAYQFWSANNPSAYKIGIDTLKISGAPGGIFTSSGLIKSFWYIP